MKKQIITKPILMLFMLLALQSCTTSSPYESIPNESENENEVENGNGNSNGNTNGNGTGNTSGNTSGTVTTSGSTTGGNKSHNMGLNCMNCHYGGGQGQGTWVVAGTVYKQNLTTTNPNTTVKLYTGPNGTGTLKYIMNVDGKGNFYTSQSIDFTGGLYPSVTNGTNTNYMGSSITAGQCNSCHTGTSTARIWIN